MKKFLSLAMAVLFAGSAVALDNVPKAGTTYQVNVGFNVTNISGFDLMDSNVDGTFNPKLGVNVGAKVEFMLPNAYGTFINLGLDWTQKGARKTVTSILDHDEEMTVKMQAHYIEIPIHVGYRYNISKHLGVYGEVGPYFATGVTGKYKYTYDAADDKSEMLFGKRMYSTFIAPTNPDESGSQGAKIRTLQRFDCGFGFRVGVEYNNQYSLNIGGDWGLLDLYTKDLRKEYANLYKLKNNGANLPEFKHHNITITFGYRF